MSEAPGKVGKNLYWIPGPHVPEMQPPDHQEAAKFFEQRSRADTAAPAPGKTSLARMSQELIPGIREHLQEAQNILKDLQVTAARRITRTHISI